MFTYRQEECDIDKITFTFICLVTARLILGYLTHIEANTDLYQSFCVCSHLIRFQLEQNISDVGSFERFNPPRIPTSPDLAGVHPRLLLYKSVL